MPFKGFNLQKIIKIHHFHQYLIISDPRQGWGWLKGVGWSTLPSGLRPCSGERSETWFFNDCTFCGKLFMPQICKSMKETTQNTNFQWRCQFFVTFLVRMVTYRSNNREPGYPYCFFLKSGFCETLLVIQLKQNIHIQF